MSNFTDFFRLYEATHKNDLSNILDEEILICDESGDEGFCFTDINAARKFFIDSDIVNAYCVDSVDELSPSQLEEHKEYEDWVNSLDFFDFAYAKNYKNFGFNIYLPSIRDGIIDWLGSDLVNPDYITYDVDSKLIIIPLNHPLENNGDNFYYDYEHSKTEIFGVESCINVAEYDAEKELITLRADFSNLNIDFKDI